MRDAVTNIIPRAECQLKRLLTQKEIGRTKHYFKRIELQ